MINVDCMSRRASSHLICLGAHLHGMPAGSGSPKRRWRWTVRAIDLTPGMAVTAEMKTGSRRVIDYLLSPLSRTAEQALHER
jgi:hypothetical protein